MFDDFPAIVENPAITIIWPPTRAMATPPDLPLSGRPVASLTFAINYALAHAAQADWSGGNADRRATGYELRTTGLFGYHFLNLAIHLAAALVLFGVVRRTLLGDRLRDRFGANATMLAFATALLWIVHPLNTEAVTYLVQRTESLMGLFVLLSLYCAIRAAEGRHTRAWTFGAIAACALGTATKEVAATTPLLVASWDWMFLSRRRWPLYAGLAASWLLLLLTVPGARPHSVGFGLEGWTPWTYLLTESAVVLHYVRLAFWPSPLVLDPYWPMVHAAAAVRAPLIILGSLFLLTVGGLLRRRPLAFAGAWFFALLAPTSSVLPIVTEVAAEHRMYLPLAAIAALAVIGVCRLAGRTAVLATALPIAIVLGMVTSARNLDYVSDENIWRDTIAKEPGNPRARTALGANLVIAGRHAEAEPQLQAAIRLDPRNAVALSNLGIAESALGRLDAAIGHLEEAVRLRPEYVDAHENLAEAYVARRQDALAMPHYLRVLAVRPDDAVVLTHAALILAVSSDGAIRNGRMALDLAERAVRLTSRRDVAALTTMAAALAEVDRFDDAVSALREAIALSSDNPARVADLERRLAVYAAHQKVRRPARSPQP